MVRWMKITENQYFGFWILGLLLFALQEVPYMVMPLLNLKTNPIMNMQETSMALEICEKVLGILSIVLMIFAVQKNVGIFTIGTGYTRVGFVLTIVVLLLNYFGWWLYFNGHQSVGIIMFFIVLLPPLYYVCIGVWRQNWILVGTGAVFLVVHFTHVLGNLKR